MASSWLHSSYDWASDCSAFRCSANLGDPNLWNFNAVPNSTHYFCIRLLATRSLWQGNYCPSWGSGWSPSLSLAAPKPGAGGASVLSPDETETGVTLFFTALLSFLSSTMDQAVSSVVVIDAEVAKASSSAVMTVTASLLLSPLNWFSFCFLRLFSDLFVFCIVVAGRDVTTADAWPVYEALLSECSKFLLKLCLHALLLFLQQHSNRFQEEMHHYQQESWRARELYFHATWYVWRSVIW